jgi:hypothetical protein
LPDHVFEITGSSSNIRSLDNSRDYRNTCGSCCNHFTNIFAIYSPDCYNRDRHIPPYFPQHLKPVPWPCVRFGYSRKDWAKRNIISTIQFCPARLFNISDRNPDEKTGWCDLPGNIGTYITLSKMHSIRPAGECHVKPIIYDKEGRKPAGNFADSSPDPDHLSATAGFVPQLDGISSSGNCQLCNLRMGLSQAYIIIGDYV